MRNNFVLSQRGINLIKHYEGLRLTAYQPVPGDHWTIGYGSTRGVYQGMKITRQEAEDRLRSDVGWAESAVNRLVTVAISQSQFDALVSFTFNTGADAFERSTLRRELNKGNYASVDHQLSLWVWGGRPRQKLDGLIRRRKAEADLFEDVAPRLSTFKNHASFALHSRDDHKVVDTVKESRTAKTGATVAGAGVLDGGIVVLEKLNHAGASASSLTAKFSGLMEPTIVLPLVAIGVGVYIIYLKHSDKRNGRSY